MAGLSTLVDNVAIYAASSGTGAITLGSAVLGYRGAEALSNGATYSYSIRQGAQSEYGRCSYLSATNQIVRSPIFSSNGNQPINLSAGSVISFVVLAEDIVAKIVAAPLSGLGAPGIGTGLANDFYFSLSTPVTLYGPKTEFGWGNGVVLQGTAGLSAYQVWLSIGNIGSQQDFINALISPNLQNTAGATFIGTSTGDTVEGALRKVVTKQPVNQATPLRAAYEILTADNYGNWWTDTGSKKNGVSSTGGLPGCLPTNGSGGYDTGSERNVTSSTMGALWQTCQMVQWVADDCELRGHDPVVISRLTNEIALLKAAYPTSGTTSGLGSDGSADGTSNVSDDSAWITRMLVNLARLTGDVTLLPLVRSKIINTNARYLDTFTPSHQITDGALTYSNKGMLYAIAGQDAGGRGRSSTYEAAMLLASLYVYNKTNEACFLNYPVTVYAAFKALLRAPSGIYYQALQLDPNGTYDSTGFLLPIQSYQPTPVEGYTGVTLQGTMAMAVVAAQLWKITNADQYRLDAIAIVDAMIATCLQNGKVINFRDPWTSGQNFSDFSREVLTLPGADPTYAMRKAIVATGIYIATQRVAVDLDLDGVNDGFGYTAEWSGNTLPTIQGQYSTWAAWAAATAGAPQAKAGQIMTNAQAGCVMAAAVLIEPWLPLTGTSLATSSVANPIDEILAQVAINGVLSYRVKKALLDAGQYENARNLRVEPADEFTIRWDGNAPITPGDIVAITIQIATGYTAAQMTALFAAAALIP